MHDTKHWHHIEYVFPVKVKSGSTHVHGSKVAVENEHFMIEGHDKDCDKTFVDNIVVSRASPARFCDDVHKNSYVKVCDHWHTVSGGPYCNVAMAQA